MGSILLFLVLDLQQQLLLEEVVELAMNLLVVLAAVEVVEDVMELQQEQELPDKELLVALDKQVQIVLVVEEVVQVIPDKMPILHQAKVVMEELEYKYHQYSKTQFHNQQHQLAVD